MDFYSYQQKVNRLKFLIEHNVAGTSSELAENLEVSQRTIFRMIEFIKSEGNTIKFCRYTKKYKIEK